MKTSVPIYLEEQDGEVLAHPLFDHALNVTAPNLDRALQRLQPRLLMAFHTTNLFDRFLTTMTSSDSRSTSPANVHARAGARLRCRSDSGGTHGSHRAN